MMKTILADRKYSDTHLWFKPSDEQADVGLVGITDTLQERLGDLICIELPRTGITLGKDDAFVYLEGFLEGYEMPSLGGMEILEINPRLEINPDIANREPYQKGWLAKVRLSSVPRWLDAPGYAQFLEEGTIIEGA